MKDFTLEQKILLQEIFTFLQEVIDDEEEMYTCDDIADRILDYTTNQADLIGGILSVMNANKWGLFT